MQKIYLKDHHLKGGVVTPEEIVDAYINSNRALFDARGNFMKDYDAAKVLGISPAALDERMNRISKRDRANIEFGEFVPYQPSRDIIDKFDENARQLGVPNPYLKAEPVIDAISYLLEAAPLSLEALPSIENPFTTPKETTVDLNATANLNTIGAQLGGDLLAGVTVPNTGELPFDQLKNTNQKIAKGQSIFRDDITFGG